MTRYQKVKLIAQHLAQPDDNVKAVMVDVSFWSNEELDVYINTYLHDTLELAAE